jgi:hypothetical protein|nr:MAG TPA: hypothetical protein [Caudoviricetes sp.]
MLEMQAVQPKVEMEVAPAKVVYQGGGSGNVYSADINRIVTIDRAEYDVLAAKDKKTLYLIRG